MQICSICDRKMYGRNPTTQTMVCGSCTLTSSSTEELKSTWQVQKEVKQLRFEETETRGQQMTVLTVKSNHARDSVVLLNGTIPMIFNSSGIATLPVHFRPLLEFEMKVRPGRYSILGENVVDIQVPTVKLKVEEAEEIPEPVVLEDNLPSGFDLEAPVKSKKKVKKAQEI